MKIIRKPLLAGVRLVAIFEAAKGSLVFLAGLGLLALIHRDVQAVSEHAVRFFHLNPASHYPRIFLEAAANVTSGRLWALAGLAAVYAVVRWVEAYGLWYERRWAEWFALVAGGIYLPVEIYELFHHATWLKGAIFLTNVGIVGYMAYALRHSREQEAEMREP